MWFILDGLGISLGVLTWGILFFADWVIIRHVFFTWFQSTAPRLDWLPLTDGGVLLFVVYQLLVFLSWWSHLRAATTDPGTIPDRHSQAPPSFDNPKICKLCQSRWKPPRAHHCKTCQRCIFRMDHHCPWVNNCVGLANQKFFILFLGYTALCAVMTLLLLLTAAAFWLWSHKSWMEAAPPSSTALVCSGIVAVACFAGVLFVGDFLQEQIESIKLNSTLVETYQRTHGTRTTFGNHFRDVFGYCWWTWPMPYASHPSPEYTEPAVPDDPDTPLCHDMDAGDNLGIAGEDTEDVGNSDGLVHGGMRTGTAPRPRNRYEGAVLMD